MIMSTRAKKKPWFVLIGLHEKDYGIEEPTPFMDQVYLDCTHREAKVDYQAAQEKTGCSED